MAQKYKCDGCSKRVDCQPTPMTSIILENLPLWVTYLLGGFIFYLLWWPLAIIYLEICLLSLTLHIALICPYCYHYGTNTCPSGYGVVATRFFTPKKGRNFATVFKRFIWVVLPGWVLPPIGAGYLLVQDRTNVLVWALLIAFSIVGFAILQIVSKQYGCKKCKNKKNCPWGPK